MNKRMNRSKLNIGAYILDEYARTEKHISDVKKCGVDFIVCLPNDRAALDLFEKYKLGAVVTGVVPGWWGGDGNNAGTMAATNPIDKYTEAAKSFVDHPAVWAIDAGDEPSALDFPHYGRVIDEMNRAFENQFAYINLYPNYASVSQNSASQTVNQLGTPTYAEHIDAYCKNVPTDYICYDFYPCGYNNIKHYENLRIVANACRATGRSLWIVLQVNSRTPEVFTTENQLRFQSFSSMAFGAENIIWACYTAGWWHNQVLDAKGEKTEQYDKLTRVNAELHAFSDEYMKLRNTSTHFVGFDGVKGFETVNQASLDALDTGVFNQLTSDAPIIVGEMSSRTTDGKKALFIFAADDPDDVAPKKVNVSFKCFGEPRLVGNAQLSPKSCHGRYTLTLDSNGAALVIVE